VRFLRCVLLLSLAFPCLVQAGLSKRNKAKSEATDIVYAINSFYNDYGHMPVDAATEDSRKVIQVLIAENRSANPRQNVYLELESSDTDGSFPDPWGMQYVVYLDHDYDGNIAIYEESFRTPAIAQSAGPDRHFGTQDDIFPNSLGLARENLAPIVPPPRIETFVRNWLPLVPVVGFLGLMSFGIWKRKWKMIAVLLILVFLLLLLLLFVVAPLLI